MPTKARYRQVGRARSHQFFEKTIEIQEERTKALERHVKVLQEELRTEAERRTRAETLLEIQSNFFRISVKGWWVNSVAYFSGQHRISPNTTYPVF